MAVRLFLFCLTTSSNLVMHMINSKGASTSPMQVGKDKWEIDFAHR